MEIYDALVIGSGQAGTPLAKKLAQSGLKTALIEKRWIGGTCINDGCTPTKALIASARTAYVASKSSDLGIDIPKYSVDFPKVMQRQHDIVLSFRDSSEKGLKEMNNLSLMIGEAEFISKDTLKVKLTDGSTKELKGKRIFINTGTTTSIPLIEGIETVDYLSSTTILNLKTLPKHLLIIGGGYIGLEYGQMFKRLGSDVTIIDSSPRFLPKEDGDIADEIKKILEDEGLKIHTGAKPQRFEKEPDGKVKLTFTTKEKEQLVVASTHVLVAAGRKPQTSLLRPENAGIALTERGFIKVNDKLETNIKGIYALGEANGGPAFTHISYHDFIVVSKNILENGNLSIKDRPVPYCMFTDPQLGRIGLTESEAREKGFTVKIAKLPMRKTARGIETGETSGLMKAVIDANTKKILGAAVLGYEGGEIMSVLQIAIQAEMTYEQLRYNVFAHPTFSESLNNLFMQFATNDCHREGK